MINMMKHISRTILYSAVYYVVYINGVKIFSIDWWIVFLSLIGISVISQTM